MKNVQKTAKLNQNYENKKSQLNLKEKFSKHFVRDCKKFYSNIWTVVLICVPFILFFSVYTLLVNWLITYQIPE